MRSGDFGTYHTYIQPVKLPTELGVVRAHDNYSLPSLQQNELLDSHIFN